MARFLARQSNRARSLAALRYPTRVPKIGSGMSAPVYWHGGARRLSSWRVYWQVRHCGRAFGSLPSRGWDRVPTERSPVWSNALPIYRSLLPRDGGSGGDRRRRNCASDPLWLARARRLHSWWRVCHLVGHGASVGQVLHALKLTSRGFGLTMIFTFRPSPSGHSLVTNECLNFK